MEILNRVLDIRSLIIFILIGILSLLVDSHSLKNQKLTRELKILQIISYFYIVFGIIIFIVMKKF